LSLKENLGVLESVEGDIECHQGPSVGALLVLKAIAERLHIVEALGEGVEGRRRLWQVLARAMQQGSRLSAVRLARRQGTCDLLGLGRGNVKFLGVKFSERTIETLSGQGLLKSRN
jgi:hypothetical protein